MTPSDSMAVSVRSPKEASTVRLDDNSLIAVIRLALATSVLLVFYLAPSTLGRQRPAVLTVLLLYILYSVIQLGLALRGTAYIAKFKVWTLWIDLGWYV